ncbi:MAG: EF-P lysine aminoacylase GenX [Simkaniaceae bacterium]|nr:EF-P lysine aminoacylase GenX [Simkaniaceae bacterium]
MSPELKSSSLKIRANSFKLVRTFFVERNVLEVDTPILSKYGPIDAHIDLLEVALSKDSKGFLHSSPEYGMKKLLALGLGDIYQLGHVFRKDETGPLHSVEFTMIEWYKVNTTFEEFLQDNLALVRLFVGELESEVLSYSKAFELAVGTPLDSPKHKLMEQGKLLGFDFHDEEDIINLLWGCVVEPTLGKEKITVITHFPKDQAALAQVKDGFAERFEFYVNGIELGNGYHELTDPIEQKLRLEKANEERTLHGKSSFQIDPDFILALEIGLPDCYGIALGFDRLLMLKENRSSIHL